MSFTINKNLRILIFVSKNLPNYARVNCKAPIKFDRIDDRIDKFKI